MRILRFLFRNWPLKLAAVVLATLLYVGIIVSASAGSYDGSVPIIAIGQPDDVYLLKEPELPNVTGIRYLVIGSNRQPITQKSFTATIDLSGITAVPGAPPISVPVTVRATDAGSVQILDFQPSRVQVRLDPIVTTSGIPVEVDRGVVPEGVDPRPAVLARDTVSVSGPDSAVRLVDRALARVRIQAVDFNQDVDLVAVDARGEEVTGVRLEPRSVRVTIQVNPRLSTKTVPVNPVVTGAPAIHWSVNSVVVAPVLVTIEGSPATLEAIESVDTDPVSVSGVARDTSVQVGLRLPADVVALGVSEVRVSIDVEQDIGSRSFEVGLELRNADPDTTYRVAVDRVIATLSGPLGDIDALDAASLIATLNVNNLDPGRHVVRVTLVVPPNLDLIAVSPQEVSVTVTPKPTPTPEPSPEPSAEPSPSAESSPPASAEPTPGPTPSPSPAS